MYNTGNLLVDGSSMYNTIMYNTDSYLEVGSSLPTTTSCNQIESLHQANVGQLTVVGGVVLVASSQFVLNLRSIDNVHVRLDNHNAPLGHLRCPPSTRCVAKTYSS